MWRKIGITCAVVTLIGLSATWATSRSGILSSVLAAAPDSQPDGADGRGPGPEAHRHHGPPQDQDGRGGRGRDDDDDNDGPPPPPRMREMMERMHGMMMMHPPKMENAAFMGIAPGPVDATLRDQLGLPKAFGLVVEQVVDDSPAKAAGIMQHDVLTKLNDQMLVLPEQLTILVRSMKPGTSVELTLIRKAKEMKVTVKLGEKVLPELPEPGEGGPGRMMPPPMGGMGPMGGRGMGPRGEMGPRDGMDGPPGGPRGMGGRMGPSFGPGPGMPQGGPGPENRPGPQEGMDDHEAPTPPMG